MANIGLTSLLIRDHPVPLTSALEVAERELMGEFASCWPLTKVLDIGGSERCPRYTNVEPPVSGECIVLP